MTGSPRGRFITLEGGEGAGKSVQAKQLEEKLASLGLNVVRTREPGGSPHAEELRQAILSGFAAESGPEAKRFCSLPPASTISTIRSCRRSSAARG